MIRWTAWSTVAALLLALAREARAEEPSPEMLMQHTPRVLLAVKLSYTRGKGAERCPDDEGVRWRVLVHSDYDPFEQRPDRYPAGVLRLVVTGASNRLTGTYTYVDEKGQTWSTLSRTFSGTGQLECYWLLDFLAAGISVDFIVRESLLAMRLERATKPKPKPEPVEPPVCSAPLPCADSRYSIWPSEWPMPPLEKPKPDPPKPPEKAPLAFRFGPGVWVDRISDDRGSLGLTLDASVRYRWGSVGIEVRGDPAIGTTTYSKGTETDSVRFARITGALLLCGQIDPLVACLKGQAGRMLFPGSVPPEPAQLYAAAGVLLGLEFPVTPSRFILRVDGELLPTIDPASATNGKQTVLQVAGLNAGLGITALFALDKR